MDSSSSFVKHHPCPKCGSRDNYAEFSDGHFYCFGCGTLSFASDANRVRTFISPKAEKIFSDTPLPEDVDSCLPAVALQWLAKYQLTTQEILLNRLMWSDKKSYLVFPYFDKYRNLVAWQGRYFGDNHKHPKWLSKGNIKSLYHILPPREEYDRIVVVEDIISAIKVARHVPCMPLFGSQIGLERLVRLSKLTDRVSIWLDYDKRSYAVSESSKSLCSCDVIITELDPKEYSDCEIKEYLNVL